MKRCDWCKLFLIHLALHTKLHGVTSQKPAVATASAARTSCLAFINDSVPLSCVFCKTWCHVYPPLRFNFRISWWILIEFEDYVMALNAAKNSVLFCIGSSKGTLKSGTWLTHQRFREANCFPLRGRGVCSKTVVIQFNRFHIHCLRISLSFPLCFTSQHVSIH
jgi:hypothetical protein